MKAASTYVDIMRDVSIGHGPHLDKASQQEYLRLNGKYLAEAQELLAKEDYPQASEKLWGAAAEIVKAVAAKRGRELGTHRSIGEFVSKLAKEKPEWDLIEEFSVASALQTNFYEDHMPSDHVVKNAETVKEFVAKVKSLL
jgi:hypothetical protein